MTRRCAHVRATGARCSRSARDGHETCAAHDPARPAKVSKRSAPIVESVVEHEASPRSPSAPAADNVLDGALVERTRLLAERGAEVWRADWRGLLDRARELGGVDSLIVDAPYSERTHAGHDGGDRYDGSAIDRGDLAYGHRQKTRGINYRPWSDEDVRAFVDAWEPLVRGWFVSITDDRLAQVWRDALDARRYAFAPLPLVEIGSRVRLSGDGPSSWTCHVVVARPKTAEFRRWGTLRGAYVYTGHGDRVVMGGKRLASMVDLVRDYTRPGDLVCDPCCGAGTTGLAAIMEGRRALLGDAMEEHARLAVDRLRAMPGETKAGQLALLAK